ncbi:MAG: electron transfer flavoprotein subunit alpha/FixB family protein [Pirellulales bacterium]|nr:electron transfer flavoprotein subunit alpha/FixB family protein [Pirellulales bacterium]
MNILVIAEHDGRTIRAGSRSALGFAHSLAQQTDGRVTCLVLGDQLHAVSHDAAQYADVLVAECSALANPVADRYATVIHQVVAEHGFDLVAAAATTYAKDIVGRAAGLLGGAMASDVLGYEVTGSDLLWRRAMYAGAVTATVRLRGEPKVVTVRASSYEEAGAAETAGTVTAVDIDESRLPGGIEFQKLESKATGRPDVTEARVVVSGGRAIKNSEDFENLVGGLADAIGGATGSSRALVDAGITPNELQVGQTGKVVAPDLYFALGISGAVQHLAGMKNSKVIAAVNNDPDAPIFEVADYGLVGDVYEVVPKLIASLRAQ